MNLEQNLNELLSDLNVFYRKLQNYHWNVTGQDFFQAHSKLEELYNEINEQIDEIAEHILILGEEPLGTLKDYLEKANITEAENKKIKSQEVFQTILKDYKKLLEKVTEIKEIKYAWGSCSNKKNITINLELIKYSQKAIRYVILHELCHIKYMNHSKEFWELVEKYMPKYKEVQKEFK